jgi:hypothetical protein
MKFITNYFLSFFKVIIHFLVSLLVNTVKWLKVIVCPMAEEFYIVYKLIHYSRYCDDKNLYTTFTNDFAYSGKSPTTGNEEYMISFQKAFNIYFSMILVQIIIWINILLYLIFNVYFFIGITFLIHTIIIVIFGLMPDIRNSYWVYLDEDKILLTKHYDKYGNLK